MSVHGFTEPLWVGIVQTNAPKYLKGAENNTIRQRLLLAFLKKRGRIKLNYDGGPQLVWAEQFAEPPVSTYADGAGLDFARHDLYRQRTIGWKMYKATDSMTDLEKKVNRGDTAIVRLWQQKLATLADAMKNQFSLELYVNSNLPANADRFSGNETFLGAGTVTAADKIAAPSATYGQLSTVLGAQGGTWSADASVFPNASLATDWPDGFGEVSYDFGSPKLLNSSSTAWTGSANPRDNMEYVIRAAQIWCTATSGAENCPDLMMMTPQMFYEYKNLMSARSRLVMPFDSESADLGFKDVMTQDGVKIYFEHGVPANTGYMFNFDKMAVMSLAPNLFESEGPVRDVDTQGYKYVASYTGNAQYYPKYFAKIYPYA